MSKIVTLLRPDELEELIYKALRLLRGHRKHIRRIARRLRELVEHGVKEARRRARFGTRSYGLLSVKITGNLVELEITVEAKYVARHRNEPKLVHIVRKFKACREREKKIVVEVRGGSRKQRWKPLYRLLTASIKRDRADPETVWRLAKKYGLGRRLTRKVLRIEFRDDVEAARWFKDRGYIRDIGLRQIADLL